MKVKIIEFNSSEFNVMKEHIARVIDEVNHDAYLYAFLMNGIQDVNELYVFSSINEDEKKLISSKLYNEITPLNIMFVDIPKENVGLWQKVVASIDDNNLKQIENFRNIKKIKNQVNPNLWDLVTEFSDGECEQLLGLGCVYKGNDEFVVALMADSFFDDQLSIGTLVNAHYKDGILFLDNLYSM